MSKLIEERITEYLGKQRLDGILISNHINVRYVSGYTGGEAFLLFTQDNQYMITDPRYTEQVSYECPEYTIVNWRSSEYGSMPLAVGGICKKEGIKNLAFEADHTNVSFYNVLSQCVKADLIPVSNVVEELRSHKTQKEIEYLRASCEIASRAYDRILKDIHVGITEKELAANLSRYMVLEGADTRPYGGILISGPKTSLLHGIPTERPIEYGDFVLMDYGCQFHGYMSDMTRTIVVGKATAKQKEVYNLVYKMVEDTENCIKAGVSAKEAYDASIQCIKNTEYFDYHYSGIGHGIGLFVHEMPFIRPTSEDILAKDTVTTVEPGLYIPGWGGVRIEDQVLVTEKGNEVMISATKELIEL